MFQKQNDALRKYLLTLTKQNTVCILNVAQSTHDLGGPTVTNVGAG